MPSGDGETSAQPEDQGVDLESYTSKFNGIVRNAQAAIFWERLWPRLVPPASVTGLFASASWLGAWEHLPVEGRIAGVLLSTAALIASPFLWKTKSLNVSKDEAVKRIDKVTGTTRREAEQFFDRITPSGTASDQAIFDLHREGIAEKWGDKFQAGKPHPDVASRDPHRLRYAIALLTVISAAVANQHAVERLTEAFNWQRPPVEAPKPAPIEVKAWVTPPEGVSDPPPLYLTQDSKDDAQGGTILQAHKNSKLTVLTFESNVNVVMNGLALPAKAIGAKDAATQGKPTFQHEVTLPEGPVTITIGKSGGQQLDWHFTVLPDNSPTAAIDSIGKDEKDPNALNLNYKKKDDYGVTESTVIIKPLTLDPNAKPLPSSKLPEIKIQ